MTTLFTRTIPLLVLLCFFSCSKKDESSKIQGQDNTSANTLGKEALYEVSKEPLSADIVWETNDTDPVFSSTEAKRGGTFTNFIDSFPLTLRTVGPDSNGGFAGVMRALQLAPTEIHPTTRQPTPLLATHWAYSADQKTVYYKLNPKAKWSDGKPLTVDDFIFALEMYKSKAIVAPWYNEYYTETFEKVVKYDDHTMAIVGKLAKAKDDIHYFYGFGPFPKHFYVLDDNFVKKYNWEIPPTLAAYQLDKIEKGKFITLKRISDWWGNDERFLKNRYNVETIKYTIIRDLNVAYEHFKKGELDSFSITLPDFWHNKAVGDIYDKGYVHKLWFYTNSPQPDSGIWMNMDREIFKDINVRIGFSHAMNIDKVLQTVLRGDYERLNTGATGYGPYENTTIKARPYDLKLVDEYLGKAGWGTRGPDGIRTKDGKKFAVQMLYGAPHHTDRLVVLKEEAKKAGIELELKLMDGESAFKAMLEKQHDVAHTGWAAQWRPEWWGQYHSANASKPQTNNFSNVKDPELDQYIDSERKEFDPNKKAELSRKIQQRIYDLALYVPTYLIPYFRQAYWRWIKLPEAYATDLSDSATEPLGTGTGGLFWIDENVKKETLDAIKSGKTFPAVTIKTKRH